jgi:hypothetical protein
VVISDDQIVQNIVMDHLETGAAIFKRVPGPFSKDTLDLVWTSQRFCFLFDCSVNLECMYISMFRK